MLDDRDDAPTGHYGVAELAEEPALTERERGVFATMQERGGPGFRERVPLILFLNGVKQEPLDVERWNVKPLGPLYASATRVEEPPTRREPASGPRADDDEESVGDVREAELAAMAVRGGAEVSRCDG